VLSLDLALDTLEPATRGRVRVVDAPLVEGAIVAAVQASVGSSIEEVAAAAKQAADLPRHEREAA
jgi:dihydroxyacetone kinase DhaKLM complex PTS-EIIA-like component DhaM